MPSVSSCFWCHISACELSPPKFNFYCGVHKELTINPSAICIFFQAEDKVRIQQEKLEIAEQNLNQSLRKAEALPKIEEELAVQMAALNEVPQ